MKNGHTRIAERHGGFDAAGSGAQLRRGVVHEHGALRVSGHDDGGVRTLLDCGLDVLDPRDDGPVYQRNFPNGLVNRRNSHRSSTGLITTLYNPTDPSGVIDALDGKVGRLNREGVEERRARHLPHVPGLGGAARKYHHHTPALAIHQVTARCRTSELAGLELGTGGVRAVVSHKRRSHG